MKAIVKCISIGTRSYVKERSDIFVQHMSRYIGTLIDVEPHQNKKGFYRGEEWNWHPDWITIDLKSTIYELNKDKE